MISTNLTSKIINNRERLLRDLNFEINNLKQQLYPTTLTFYKHRVERQKIKTKIYNLQKVRKAVKNIDVFSQYSSEDLHKVDECVNKLLTYKRCA